MARGQLPKAYLRMSPNLDAHPDPGAMVILMCWANRQLPRGHFKTLDALRGALGVKRLKQCLDRGDLVRRRNGRYYLDGWDEWQEGDFTVGERVARLRNRRKGDPDAGGEGPLPVNKDVECNGDVTVNAEAQGQDSPLLDRSSPSEALRRLGVKANNNDPPTPPAVGGGADASDPWELPPGIAQESTIEGAGRQRALARLVAIEKAQGRELGPKKKREFSKRLGAGAREEDLAAELRTKAEKRQVDNTEATQWDAALDWIDAHGGKATVLKNALAWLSTNHGNGDDLQLSVRRWEAQAHAPPKVSSAILPDVSLAYQRAPRAARGG
jgi:hypothetical protein